MSGHVRLSVSKSLSPYPALEPIPAGSSQSATLAQAEREITTLREENLRLKQEIAEIGAAYKQLVTENSHENFDERRVNFLKAQIIQLERQVLLFSEALSSRAATLLDVENSLAAIADLCRSHAGGGGSVGQVGVPRADLARVIETAESARIKLYKNIENTSTDKLECPVKMFDKFIRHSPHKPVTLLDVCSGKLDHLNLKHVAKLESSLSQLYKQLMLVLKSLGSIINQGNQYESANQNKENLKPTNHNKDTFKPTNHMSASFKAANRDLPRTVYTRLGAQVTKACNMLKDTTQELMTLGVLVPAAPWPPLKKPFLKDITTQDVMAQLSGVPRSKVNECKHVIDSLLKALNYSSLVASAETRALKEELQFHQTVYDHQKHYIEDLFLALRKSYGDFQDGTDSMICDPLKEILRIYETLQTTASEDALKYFLQIFKEKAPQLSNAVKKLSSHLHGEEGQEAISDHGEQLFAVLGELCMDRQRERDEQLANLELVQEQLKRYKEEIAAMFPKSQASERVSEVLVESSVKGEEAGSQVGPGRVKDTEVLTRNQYQEQGLSLDDRPPWNTSPPEESQEKTEESSTRREKAWQRKGSTVDERPPWDSSPPYEIEKFEGAQESSRQRKGRIPLDERPPWDDGGSGHHGNLQLDSDEQSKRQGARMNKPVDDLESRPPWDDSFTCNCGAEDQDDQNPGGAAKPTVDRNTKQAGHFETSIENKGGSTDARERSDAPVVKTKPVGSKPPRPAKGVPQSRLVLKKDTGKQRVGPDKQSAKDLELLKRDKVRGMRKSDSSPNVSMSRPNSGSFEVHDSSMLPGSRPPSCDHGNTTDTSMGDVEYSTYQNVHASGNYRSSSISPFSSDPIMGRPRSGSLTRLGQRSQKSGQLEPLMSAIGQNSNSTRTSIGKPSWR